MRHSKSTLSYPVTYLSHQQPSNRGAATVRYTTPFFFPYRIAYRTRVGVLFFFPSSCGWSCLSLLPCTCARRFATSHSPSPSPSPPPSNLLLSSSQHKNPLSSTSSLLSYSSITRACCYLYRFRGNPAHPTPHSLSHHPSSRSSTSTQQPLSRQQER